MRCSTLLLSSYHITVVSDAVYGDNLDWVGRQRDASPVWLACEPGLSYCSHWSAGMLRLTVVVLNSSKLILS